MSTTAMCARQTGVRRSLMGASLCFLFASQAQALPFGLACLSGGSQAPTIQCRPASGGILADRIRILAPVGGDSVFFGPIAGPPPAFESGGGEPGQIVFSL